MLQAVGLRLLYHNFIIKFAVARSAGRGNAPKANFPMSQTVGLRLLYHTFGTIRGKSGDSVYALNNIVD